MWAEALPALASGELGVSLTQALSASPHAAFFWETPPLSLDTVNRVPFEMVTVNAPQLAESNVKADRETFARYLEGCDPKTEGARSFPNLKGDSTLVAPCPLPGSPEAMYKSLASFVRGATSQQISKLWAVVGLALQKRLAQAGSSVPLWLSTEGTGVAWLHVRLDPMPKYFHYRPYRSCFWACTRAPDTRFLRPPCALYKGKEPGCAGWL